MRTTASLAKVVDPFQRVLPRSPEELTVAQRRLVLAGYRKDIHVNIIEIQRPETDAQLVAESIAMQLERRVAFRRAMKKGMESAFRFGAQGIKIRCAGRLNGAEIARAEWYQEGRLPLHTLKADIDYGFAEANTTYGKIGVKAWIYRGEQHKAKTRRKTA